MSAAAVPTSTKRAQQLAPAYLTPSSASPSAYASVLSGLGGRDDTYDALDGSQAVYGSGVRGAAQTAVPFYANPLYTGPSQGLGPWLAEEGNENRTDDEDGNSRDGNSMVAAHVRPGGQLFPPLGYAHTPGAAHLTPLGGNGQARSISKPASHRCVAWVAVATSLALVLAVAALGLVTTARGETGDSGSNDTSDRDSALTTSASAVAQMSALEQQLVRLQTRLLTIETGLTTAVANDLATQAQLAILSANVATLPTMLKSVVAECGARTGVLWGRQTLQVAAQGTVFCTTEFTPSKLLPHDGTVGDRFGTSVAIGGSGLIVAGAYHDDNKHNDSGSAYLYQVDGTQQPHFLGKLVADNGGAGDEFGISVAVSSDGLIAVGARHADVQGNNTGAAFLYRVNATGAQPHVQLVAKLLPTDGEPHDNYGRSVAAASGGLVVIGSFFDSDRFADAGSAYVYKINTTTSMSQLVTKLLPADGAKDDHFGVSVAMNDAGLILIGAHNRDTQHGNGSGCVYVYQMNTAGTAPPEPITQIVPHDGTPDGRFGFSVAVSPDGLAVVGAYKSGSGSAYAYRMSEATGMPVLLTKLLPADGSAGDQFGISVAAGDNGLAVIGAFADADKGINSGSAYLFRVFGVGVPAQLLTKLVAADGAAYNLFGRAVAIDPEGRVVVTEVFDDDNGKQSGSAYVYSPPQVK